MKGFHGKGTGSQDMPHGMPEGTIKEVYSQIKEHGHGKEIGRASCRERV